MLIIIIPTTEQPHSESIREYLRVIDLINQMNNNLMLKFHINCLKCERCLGTFTKTQILRLIDPPGFIQLPITLINNYFDRYILL